jgi:hypothetical protein
MATALPRWLGRSSGFILNRGFLPLLLNFALACSAHTNASDGRAAEGASSAPGASNSPSSTWCVAEPLRPPEAERGVVGPLASLNAQFLQAHARARALQCEELESNGLVLRYSFGVLEAYLAGKEITHTYVLPKEYHPVKDVSHAVYLSALLFAEPPGAERNRHIVQALAALDAALADLLEPTSATATLLPVTLHERESRLLQRTRDAVASFSAGRLGPDSETAYFESVRDDLKANLRDMAIASLRELHAAVVLTQAKVAKEDPKAWDSALVVIGVMHQARAREIGIQYFERLLGEHAGEGARNERRMVVAEHMTAPSDQLGLLSAHLVDERGATMIFADPLRLQWDALGDVDPAALDMLFHQ